MLAGLVVAKASGRSTAAAIDAGLWSAGGLQRLAFQDEQTLPEGYGMRGGMPGYRSVLAVYPEHHLSVVILTPSRVDVMPYVQYLVNAGSLLQ